MGSSNYLLAGSGDTYRFYLGGLVTRVDWLDRLLQARSAGAEYRTALPLNRRTAIRQHWDRR